MNKDYRLNLYRRLRKHLLEYPAKDGSLLRDLESLIEDIEESYKATANDARTKKNSKLRYDRLRAANLCVGCTNPSDGKHAFCFECRKYRSGYYKRSYQKRIAEV